MGEGQGLYEARGARFHLQGCLCVSIVLSILEAHQRLGLPRALGEQDRFHFYLATGREEMTENDKVLA